MDDITLCKFSADMMERRHNWGWCVMARWKITWSRRVVGYLFVEDILVCKCEAEYTEPLSLLYDGLSTGVSFRPTFDIKSNFLCLFTVFDSHGDTYGKDAGD
jgi:hypothetical protein